MADGSISDDRSRDYGTRFVPDRHTPVDFHLSQTPVPFANGATERLSKALPDRLEDPVIPPANVPEQHAVQKLIEKVFSEKDQEKEFTESEVFHVPELTKEEADKAAEADAKAAKKLEADREKEAAAAQKSAAAKIAKA